MIVSVGPISLQILQIHTINQRVKHSRHHLQPLLKLPQPTANPIPLALPLPRLPHQILLPKLNQYLKEHMLNKDINSEEDLFGLGAHLGETFLLGE